MDDVGFLLTMQIGAQSRVSMRCLPIPVLSGPTSGATWALDIWEWYVQVRRWAIGTADNFHYMCVKMGNLPFIAAFNFTLGYFLYYGIILCSGPLFSLNSCVFQFVCPDDSESAWGNGHGTHWLADWFGSGNVTPNRLLFILSSLPYVFYACMFFLDAWWCKYILHVQEDISLPRNIMHWLMVGPSMIAYSLTQLHGYNVIAFKGKVGACIHQLAGKATLSTGQGLDGLNRVASPATAAATADRIADEQFEEDEATAAESGQSSASGAAYDQ